jgi:hypothetical protein
LQHHALYSSLSSNPKIFRTALGVSDQETAGTDPDVLTRGAVSNAACRSRIRLFEPFTRKAPSTSVANLEVSGLAIFIYGVTYHTPLSIGHCMTISTKRN